MRQTYLSLGGGSRVLKAIALPKFAANCYCAAVQQWHGKLSAGRAWGRQGCPGSLIAVGLYIQQSCLSSADRQKDGQYFQRRMHKTKHLNSHGFLELHIFVAAAEIGVSSSVLPDW